MQQAKRQQQRPGAAGRARRKIVIFEPQFFLLLALLLVLSAIAYLRGGGELLAAGLGEGAQNLLRFGLLIVCSFLSAGLISTLLPREWIEGALGFEAGMRGILVGAGAGLITPGGPFISMPIAAALLRAGAAPAPVVAYLTAWALLSLQRLVAWEIPILGARFALIRFGISLLLALAAGLLARLAERWLTSAG